MKTLMRLLPILVAAGAVVSAQPPPRELSDLSKRAGLESPIAAWCRGELRPADRGGYAVAVMSAADRGSYLAVGPDATVVHLGSFAGRPQLSCYTPAEARKLDATIHRSETIQGRIAPRWRTTVVCGFVDNTTAVCWQYAPPDHTFVKVGGWVT